MEKTENRVRKVRKESKANRDLRVHKALRDWMVYRVQKGIRESREKMGRTEKHSTPTLLMQTAQMGLKIFLYPTVIGNISECMLILRKMTAQTRQNTHGVRSKAQMGRLEHLESRELMERPHIYISPMQTAQMARRDFPPRMVQISSISGSIQIIHRQIVQMLRSIHGQRSKANRGNVVHREFPVCKGYKVLKVNREYRDLKEIQVLPDRRDQPDSPPIFILSIPQLRILHQVAR